MGASLLVIDKGWKLLFEEAEEFAYPEDEGGGADDDCPVGEAEGGDVEEFTSDAYDQYLAE